jgi:hypothetical protein
MEREGERVTVSMRRPRSSLELHLEPVLRQRPLRQRAHPGVEQQHVQLRV